MEKKRLLLPIKMSLKENAKFSLTDDRFIPVDILVMHNGINSNASYFSDDAIKKAEWSLRDVPIRGYIKETDDGFDFDEHNMSIELTEDNDFIIKSICQTWGNIPADNNLRYETIGDKTYVKVEGYLWSKYLNEAENIFRENSSKSVSMEIEIDDAYFEEDLLHITDYRYLGVVVLGEDVEPAMKGARIDIRDIGVEDNYYTKEDKMTNDKKDFTEESVEVVETSKEEIQEEVKETTEETTEENLETLEEEKEEVVEEATEPADEVIDISELAKKAKAMEEELNELREYKAQNEALKSEAEKKAREEAIEKLFEEYSACDIDLESIRENIEGKEVEEIEKEIAVEFLKSKFSKQEQAINIKNDDNNVIVEDNEQVDYDNPYGKYGSNMKRNK